MWVLTLFFWPSHRYGSSTDIIIQSNILLKVNLTEMRLPWLFRILRKISTRFCWRLVMIFRNAEVCKLEPCNPKTSKSIFFPIKRNYTLITLIKQDWVRTSIYIVLNVLKRMSLQVWERTFKLVAAKKIKIGLLYRMHSLNLSPSI